MSKAARPGRDIDFTKIGQPGSKPANVTPAAPTRPYTGLGLMSAAVAGAKELEKQVEAQKEQIEQLEHERGAQPLDPKTIQQSRWSNRHETSFACPEFWSLKAEIEDAGGNVQPIKVRPLPSDRLMNGFKYELVFGHRRHRACLELGLPVLAIVQEVDDRGLWVEMERENRGRKDLSAWEQGMMYLRALESGLFPSQAALARAIGRAAQDVSEATRIASLPTEVVAAFRSPNDIQFRWAKPLADAAKADPMGIIRRAKQLASDGLMEAAPAKVFAALVAQAPAPEGIRPSDALPPKRLDLGRGRHVDVRAKGGRVTLELDAAMIGPDGWATLEKALQKIAEGANRG